MLLENNLKPIHLKTANEDNINPTIICKAKLNKVSEENPSFIPGHFYLNRGEYAWGITVHPFLTAQKILKFRNAQT